MHFKSNRPDHDPFQKESETMTWLKSLLSSDVYNLLTVLAQLWLPIVLVSAVFSSLTSACPSLSGLVLRTCLVAIVIAAVLFYVRLKPMAAEAAKEFIRDVHLIAHRGCGHDAPENTVAAFKLAKENGASGVEFDVDFTADGVAVLLHDGTVDRTTNGSGHISTLTHSQVQALDAGAKHHLRNDESVSLPVPSLEFAVEEILELGLKLYIDIKQDHPQMISTLLRLFDKHPDLYRSAIVCSFYPQIIYKLRAMDPRLVTALTWRPRVVATVREGVLRNKQAWKQWLGPVMDWLLEWSLHSFIWYLCGPSLFLVSKSVCSYEYTKLWRDRGLAVTVWTVNDPLEKSFFVDKLSVSIMTDCLGKGQSCRDNCCHEITDQTQ